MQMVSALTNINWAYDSGFTAPTLLVLLLN